MQVVFVAFASSRQNTVRWCWFLHEYTLQEETHAVGIDRWWKAMSMSGMAEVTDRKDLGVDLNTPQRRDDGEEYYGYSLIREVEDGDIVLHYHKPARAIISWSLATGHIWEDVVHWGAHEPRHGCGRPSHIPVLGGVLASQGHRRSCHRLTCRY